ncbi:MAG: hypothetical protein ACRDBP_19330 [Luteolibacter sp.]
MISRQTLLFAAFSFFLRQSVAAAEATSVEVFVGSDHTSHRETVLTVTGYNCGFELLTEGGLRIILSAPVA